MNIAVVLDPEAVEAFADILTFFQDHTAPVRLTLFGLCPPAPATLCHPLSRLEPRSFDLILDLRQDVSGEAELPGGVQGKGLAGPAARSLAELLRHLESLLRDQEIHSGILDTATDAIITINEDHIIVGYNRGAEQMFGFTREDALGQDLSIIIPPPYKETHKDFVRRYLATRRPRLIGKHVQLTAQRRDGSEFPMSISFSVAEIRDNIYFTGIIRDITEYKEMENRLLRAERLAAVGNTVSHIAHEIKNPLAIIGGFARQLQKTPHLEDKDRRKLSIIVEEVDRLEAMLAEMRDFVKRPSARKAPGDIEALLAVRPTFVRQLENFAGVMNFVIFPMFFLSSALYPLWRMAETSRTLWAISWANPFTHAVESIRFALHGAVNWPALGWTALALAVFFALAVLGYDARRGALGTRG